MKGCADMPTSKPIASKKELFARKIVEGMSQADAYRAAYSTKNMSPKTVWEKASRLMADDKVRARVKELSDEAATESVMTARERLEFLSRVVRGEEKEKLTQVIDGQQIDVEIASALKTKLNALDIMNKMTGEYTTKIEGNVGVKLEDLL